MKETKNLFDLTGRTTLARRDVLKAAVALAGTSMVGMAAKAIAVGGEKPELRIAYWDGFRFVAPENLLTGDLTLSNALLTFEGFGENSDLRSIDVMAYVNQGGTIVPVPYIGWVAAPQGVRKTKCTFPVSKKTGLCLVANLRWQQVEVPLDVRFQTGRGLAPKLTSGTYVFSAEDVNWSALRLDPGASEGPLVAADGTSVSFAYVLMAVEPA